MITQIGVIYRLELHRLIEGNVFLWERGNGDSLLAWARDAFSNKFPTCA